MRLSRRVFLGVGAAATVLRGGSEGMTPERVHAELAAGNRRFLSGRALHPHATMKWVKQAAREGQHPRAVVLCCSDSRVAPEILFDQGMGDLFVVRVAGNVLREDEVGSIEYAVEHLHVPLCVVLGHSACGAVTAVVRGEHLPVEVDHLVSPIRDAFARVKQDGRVRSPAELVDATAKEHARATRDGVAKASAMLSEAVKARRLRVEAALYHLESGAVEWM
ncbi:MAG: carbonic anhydrase [Bryobacteraceae bacterium]|nr:carbonic anhydrase [Bryobacteraceae bacterium]